MQVVDRSTLASEYWPGLFAIFGEYERLPSIYRSFCAIETSEKAFEELLTEQAGLGLVPQQPELAPVTFDMPSDGIRNQVTFAGYGLAVAISLEAQEDGLYGDIAARLARELNFAARQTEEYIAHAPFQLAFDSSLGVRADGQPLISAAHPTASGLQDNTLVSQDISELAFEDMIIRVSYMRNPRGHFINALLERLVLSPDSGPEARRILGSPLQPNAQTNNINVLRETNAVPEVVETPYFIDKDVWFAQTNIQSRGNGQGYTFWERSDYRVREDSNWSNQASLIACYFRSAVSCADFRAVLGSGGADAGASAP